MELARWINNYREKFLDDKYVFAICFYFQWQLCSVIRDEFPWRRPHCAEFDTPATSLTTATLHDIRPLSTQRNTTQRNCSSDRNCNSNSNHSSNRNSSRDGNRNRRLTTVLRACAGTSSTWDGA